MPLDRRRFLTFGGIALTGSLAGCSSEAPASDSGENQARTTTDAATATATPMASADRPPGADVLGDPDDLRSSAAVDAATLSEDEGAGQFVFTPAVVFVEQGATVEWTVTGGSHSITSYHPDNDRPARVPGAAAAFDSGVITDGETFSHTFDTPGVHNYYCTPHEGLGMVGLVVVGGSEGGPGTAAPAEVTGAAAENLSRLLAVAGVGGGGSAASYGWQAATWDSYWYSLYNMSTNIAMSGNGVQFPHNDQQQQAFERRLPAMLSNADVDEPPIRNPNLNMAAFTRGDPQFTQKPVFDAGDGRPDASTLRWDPSKSSKTVSPASLAWTHTKGVTWAKNFEQHFDILPESLAAKFRAQMLTTLAQLGIMAGLVGGGPDGNGALTKGESLELVSGFRPDNGSYPDRTARPTHHAAMLWFLSEMTSLAQGGWFGYVNPEPLVPAEKIQQLTDGVGRTTMNLFTPSGVVDAGSTRDLGLLLGAVGWYGTHAGSDELVSAAADYADALAGAVESNLAGNGLVENGAANQAATQGVVGQGLLWASQVDGVDHSSTAESVLGYLFDELYDDAGTFASGTDDSTYRITARDAGDITGGVNAAENVLGMGVKEQYARFFNQTVNRGRLQRAERPPSRDENSEYVLPLPPAAGGEFGQAAVYNQAVEYDTSSGEWTVADDSFVTADALYLANQEIWISQWGGSFFGGRGVPGRNDSPPE